MMKNLILYYLGALFISIFPGILGGFYFSFGGEDNHNIRDNATLTDIQIQFIIGFILGMLPVIILAIKNHKRFLKYCE